MSIPSARAASPPAAEAPLATAPRRVFLNAGAMAVAGVIAQLCLTSVEAYIARRLGQHAYGIFGSVYAMALSSAWIVECGLAWKLVQDGSRRPAAIAGLLGTSLVLKAAFACVVGPAMLLVLQALGYPAEVRGVFAILFGYVVLLVAQDTLAAVNAARQRMHVTAVFQGAAPVAIGVLVLALAPRSLPTVGFAYVAGAGLATAAWAAVVFRSERPRVEMRQAGAMLRGSWHYGLTGALTQVYWRSGLLLLPLLRGFQEAGLYAAADKLIDLGLKAGVLGSRVLAPVLFAESETDPAAYARSSRLVLRAVSLVGGLGCLIMALIAEPLVTLLFGEAFRPAAAILVVLSASLAARLVVMTLQLVLSASSEHARRTGALALSLAGAVGLTFLLAPGYGALGAAVARAVSDFVQIGAMLGARRLPFKRAAAVGWIAAPLLTGVAAFLAAQALGAGAFLDALAGVALYGLGAFACGAVRVSEVRELAGRVRGRRSL